MKLYMETWGNYVKRRKNKRRAGKAKAKKAV